ncbi:MAG TPA: SemiSWEET family transporter [Vicinamibacterales bacterium]
MKHSSNGMTLVLLLFSVIALPACEELVVRDTQSLLAPRLHRSEIVGIVAGFGTTFAAMPDLLAMLKRRSSKGMNPRMAAIMGVFQIVWIYYGLLILSRPVIVWNAIAVVINFVSVAAYFYFARRERDRFPTLNPLTEAQRPTSNPLTRA